MDNEIRVCTRCSYTRFRVALDKTWFVISIGSRYYTVAIPRADQSILGSYSWRVGSVQIRALARGFIRDRTRLSSARSWFRDEKSSSSFRGGSVRDISFAFPINLGSHIQPMLERSVIDSGHRNGLAPFSTRLDPIGVK